MKRIVIIGAGPAGVTAALELMRRAADVKVTLLEESGEVGGISRTVLHNGNRMDIGGHRFFSKDARVNAWWNSIMPLQGAPASDDLKLGREVALNPGGPDPETSDRVMLARRRVSRIFYRRKFFDYPVRLNAGTLKSMGLVTTIRAGASYLKSALKPLNEDSLENFYINRFGRKLYSIFFEGYTEKLWGRHPRDISADWGAQRVKGLSIRAVIKDMLIRALPGRRNPAKVETSLIEQFYYPKYGPGQLWTLAAREFERAGGEVVFYCRAKSVLRKNGRAYAVIAEKDGAQIRFDADIVLSSMPIKDLIAGMNGVPKDIAAIAEGLPYRDFVTVGLLVDRLLIKNSTRMATLGGIVPDCWIYVQDTGVKLGRIQVFNNWSPYMVRDPEHSVWIGLEYFCAEGDDMWSMSDEDWARMGRAELVRMGVLSEGARVLDCHCERVKKAYPAYFDTYAQMDALIKYLDGCPNLYCIGRNGQHRYNNMDHSMATAFAAIDNILSGDREDHSAIWRVNTEKKYHEEKK